MEKALSRQIELTLRDGEEERTFNVEFPKTGDLMNIEVLKLQLSDGKYDSLKFSYNKMFVQQATVIDTIATFNTLIPKLKESMNVKSMLDLPVDKMSILVDMYEKQFLPWFEEWMAKLGNLS